MFYILIARLFNQQKGDMTGITGFGKATPNCIFLQLQLAARFFWSTLLKNKQH
jgi:hypothetical protein